MHYMDTYKEHKEKAKYKLYENAVCGLEKIPQKTSAVRPPATYHTNHSNEMNDMWGIVKEARTNSLATFSYMDAPVLADLQRLTSAL